MMVAARALSIALLALLSGASATAQDAAPGTRLARNTPVVLLATAEVNSSHAVAGTVLKLRVNEPVVVADRVVIPVGTPAFGAVVSATGAGMGGRNGKMTIRLSHIQLGAARIPITGTLHAKGSGGSARTAFAAGGILGVFYHGNGAKIKAGDIIEARISEEVILDAGGPHAGRR